METTLRGQTFLQLRWTIHRNRLQSRNKKSKQQHEQGLPVSTLFILRGGEGSKQKKILQSITLKGLYPIFMQALIFQKDSFVSAFSLFAPEVILDFAYWSFSLLARKSDSWSIYTYHKPHFTTHYKILECILELSLHLIWSRDQIYLIKVR